MVKVLSVTVVAGLVVVGATGVAARSGSSQAAGKAETGELQRAVDKVSAASKLVKAEAKKAEGPVGQNSLASLQSAVGELQQGLQNFESLISKSGRMLSADQKKDADAMAKQLAALKKQTENLTNMLQQKTDDAKARTALTKNLIGIANDLEQLTQRRAAPLFRPAK